VWEVVPEINFFRREHVLNTLMGQQHSRHRGTHNPDPIEPQDLELPHGRHHGVEI
jgi:hypothetical protein